MALSKFFQHDHPFFQRHPLFGCDFDDYLMPFASSREPIFDFMPCLYDKNNGFFRRGSSSCAIRESDKDVQISFDMPGMKKSDVSVKIENDTLLHISGGSKLMNSDRKFETYMSIGVTVDTNKLTANLADGVLVVHAPKREQEKSVRVIQVTEHPHAKL
jgi:HSP20 family molecular chaperone IbpA